MWRLRLGDDEWTAETVSVGELRFAESRTAAVMTEIDPRKSAEHCVALLVAHLHKADGEPLDKAIEKAERLTALQLVEVVGEYEVVKPSLGRDDLRSVDDLVTLCIRSYGWMPTQMDDQPVGPILRALSGP